MALSGAEFADPASPAELTGRCIGAAESLLARASDAVRAQVAPAGALEPALLEREQHAVHGLAWLATYVEALRQMQGWALRLRERGPARRARAADAAGGLRRVSGAHRRRHPDEPGRDRAAASMYLDAAAISAFAGDPAVGALIARRHGGAAARAPGRADRRRRVRRLGPRRRHAGA